MLRFQELLKTLQKTVDLKVDLLIGGDLSIDWKCANNPPMLDEIKLIIPELENFMAVNNIAQLN